jgi:hypothetical protein
MFRLSLEEAAGFTRDAFGRQSMSEKRHATLDAKNTDTYQRNKKLRLVCITSHMCVCVCVRVRACVCCLYKVGFGLRFFTCFYVSLKVYKSARFASYYCY